MKRALSLCLGLVAAAYAMPALTQDGQSGVGADAGLMVSGSERFLQTADTDKFALIITGAAASPEIRERFRNWTAQLDDILQHDYQYEADKIHILLDDGVNTGNLSSRVDGPATAEVLSQKLQSWHSDMSAGDLLSVFMIGHGAATFGDAKFNNVGPDMTGSELAE